MGQVFSNTTSAKNTPASTPQRAPNCADPRSPSRDIERTPITVNDSNEENNVTTNSTTRDEKPRKPSLRQTLLERMMKNSNSKSESSSQSD